MFERNDDVLFICYDNEAYMNTGVQRSGATPPAARTATTEAVGPNPGNPFGQGKNMPELAMAHGIPYVATATVADLHDLEAKVDPGHGDPRRPLHPHPGALPARMGLAPRLTRCRSRGWPPRPGCSRSSRRSTARSCVRRPSGAPGPGRRSTSASRRRFAHLFDAEGNPARPDIIAALQAHGRPQHPAVRPPRGSPRCRRLMDKPFAITLEVGSSLANKTGTWRVERPVYVDRLPPCNDACPAGENIQQWLYLAEDGSYEAAWRQIMRDNPFPAVMGRACFHPCQTACNRATVDETVGINAVERFLGDRAIERGLVAGSGGAAHAGGGCWSSAPDLAASQPPTTCGYSDTRWSSTSRPRSRGG